MKSSINVRWRTICDRCSHRSAKALSNILVTSLSIIGFTCFAIPIAFLDIRDHRISNRHLLAGVLTLVPLEIAMDGLNILERIESCVVFLLGSILAHTLLGMGFGDVKLIGILSFLYIPFGPQSAFHFLQLLFIAFVISLMAHLLRHKTFQGSIALAPSILGAVFLLKVGL